MRVRLSRIRPALSVTLVSLLMAALAACSGGGDGGAGAGGQDGGGATAGAGGTGSEATLTVTADNLEFDTDTIAAPAGEAFTIEFDNQDSALHNIAIYSDDSRSDHLFMGEVIGGGESVTYEIPALEAGEYYFHCDVHPDMNGTYVVE